MYSAIALSLVYLSCSTAAGTPSDNNIQKTLSKNSTLVKPKPRGPPVAKKVQHFNKYHGTDYLDEYHWLRDDTRKNSEVLSHLKKENAYSNKIMKPLKPLADTIYKDIISRIAEDDSSHPTTKGDYMYYKKSVKDLQYPIYIRKKISVSGAESKNEKEETTLDLNKFKEKQLELGIEDVSPNQKLLAYSLDTTGSGNYSIYIKNLETGETTTEVNECSGSVIWSADSKYLFYTVHDDIQRPYRVFRHKIGGISSTEELLFEEKDQKFFVALGKSLSQKYLFMVSVKKTASEFHYLDLEKPNSNFTCFSPRMEDRIYDLEHKENDFLILTNRYMGKKYINNYVLKAPVKQEQGRNDEKNWKEVVPYNKLHYVTSVYGLKGHVILGERFEGYSQIRIINDASSSSNQTEEGRLIKFPEPIFETSISSKHLDYNEPKVVYSYSSLTTPDTLYSYNLTDNSSKVLKKKQVLGGFNPENYISERLVARNKVPISVVYRKDKLKKDGSNPLHLYGYGSYGTTTEPEFQSSIFSLLDRGFVYAIAHVRGGTEMGRQWYETKGKLLKKKNTFRDFEAAASHMIKLNYTSPSVLSIEGDSAGGLLVGATINRNPKLFNAAIANVPFVDVINTMMDPSIPLTVAEYEEWGDPNDKKFFNYMLSYSPYDNLPSNPKKFPHMLVRSGLNDPRVPYWESAKYVAKLRDILSQSNSTKHTKVLQMIEMEAGHFGASGRYNQYKEVAQNYAFLISTANKVPPFKK